MRFKAIQELSDAEAIRVLELREDIQSYRICSGDRSGAMKQVEHQEPVKLAPAGDTGLVQQSTPAGQEEELARRRQ